MLDEIKRLRSLYEDGNPEISDFEYDTLVTDFLSKGGSYRDIYGDSLLKVEYPMMSQQNVYNMDDFTNVLKLIKEGMLIATPKYDGCSIYFVVDKETRKPIYCYSRHNKRLKPHVEKYLIEKFNQDYVSKMTPNEFQSDYKYLYIRCEAIISKDKFEEYKESYSNPRNMVAGLLNKKVVVEAHNDIDFKVFDMSNSSVEYSSILNNDFFMIRIENIMSLNVIDNVIREKLKPIFDKYECDGIVFRLNDTKLRNQLGNDGHHWYAEFALKNLNSEELQTDLIDVEWNMNENGKFTPVGILKPVKFKDSIVSRVMLNSNKFIKENNIKIGYKLTIIKSGDIIPKVIEVEECEGQSYDIIIEECPFCESMVEENGAYSFCENPNCSEKKKLLLIKQIVRIQTLLGLKGISSQIIRKIQNDIEERDIWYFLIFDQETKSYNVKLGEVNSQKFKNIFKKLKETKLTIGNLFSILQIQGFGNETMEKMDNFLVKKRKYLYSGKSLKPIEYWKDSIRSFFMEYTSIDKNVWLRIDKLFNDERFIKKVKMSGLKFYIPEINEEDENKIKYIITGNPISYTKSQFKKYVSEKAIQVSSVKKAQYLICNDPSKNSKKYQDGIRMNKTILTQDEFLKEIGLE